MWDVKDVSEELLVDDGRPPPSPIPVDKEEADPDAVVVDGEKQPDGESEPVKEGEEVVEEGGVQDIEGGEDPPEEGTEEAPAEDTPADDAPPENDMAKEAAPEENKDVDNEMEGAREGRNAPSNMGNILNVMEILLKGMDDIKKDIKKGNKTMEDSIKGVVGRLGNLEKSSGKLEKKMWTVVGNQEEMKKTLSNHDDSITENSGLIKNQLCLITANWTNWPVQQAKPEVNWPDQPATPAKTSNQYNNVTCVCHAIAKGLQDFLHEHKFESDQKQIIKSLENVFGKRRSHVYDFNGHEIVVTNKETGPDKKVIMRVMGALKNSRPFATPDQYAQMKKDDDSCLVLRWRIPKNRYGDERDLDVHAIYVKSYTFGKNNGRVFDCINSWGDNEEKKSEDPYPQIPECEVERVYRIKFETEDIKRPAEPDMEKDADPQTLSAEIVGDCGNFLAETPKLL